MERWLQAVPRQEWASACVMEGTGGSEHPLIQAASYMGSGCLWSPHLDDFYYVHLGSCSRKTVATTAGY